MKRANRSNDLAIEYMKVYDIIEMYVMWET
jgi:hypothetical protein